MLLVISLCTALLPENLSQGGSKKENLILFYHYNVLFCQLCLLEMGCQGRATAL